MPTIESYVSENRSRFLGELEQLLRIPSVGALPEHRRDMDRCAEHLAGLMRAAGMARVEVMATEGMPAVYGERLASPGAPTVLVYGHFDVQPVDPVELWTSPPFEPAVRDGTLFARGAADDKGQLHIHLKAAETLMKVNGSLPVNLKMIVEGEEEVGSEHLHAFIAANRGLLKADFSLISDTSWFAPDLPSICYGLRGLVYLQVNIKGADSDLHSGGFGGAVANPIQVLAEMIAALKDDRGRVVIPGFYDRVRPLTEEERRQFASLPFDENEYLGELGAPAVYGEEGYTTLERTWARPTLDPNGIWGGFTGEGTKTVLPSRASAKLSCRLVPDQDPDEVFGLLEARLRDLCPPTVTMETVRMHDARPALMPPDHPAVQAAARALDRVFHKPVAFVRSGGSIPVVASFQELLGIPSVLMGFSLPDDHAHAPDERLDLANYYGGIQAVAYLLEELGGNRAPS